MEREDLLDWFIIGRAMQFTDNRDDVTRLVKSVNERVHKISLLGVRGQPGPLPYIPPNAKPSQNECQQQG
ncbi:MAG: hypothetical protein KY455_09695 [Euryarchaeota archaeon]|nr:hypothetical protein [Euryarchaeota archaeon]